MSTAFARELVAVAVEALGLNEVESHRIDLDKPLFGDGLGLDSLDMLELSLAIQQRYGVKLRADDAHNAAVFASFNSLAAHVLACQALRA